MVVSLTYSTAFNLSSKHLHQQLRHHITGGHRGFTRSNMSMSMVTRITVASPDQFNEALSQAESLRQKNMFILFFATKNPSTGVSWCPDCVRAEPILDKAFARMTEPTTLMVCNVDRTPYKTDKTFQYRVDPRIELKCVPTLMKWENGRKSMVLNDVECMNPDVVEEMLFK